jgi:hypothetical protein
MKPVQAAEKPIEGTRERLGQVNEATMLIPASDSRIYADGTSSNTRGTGWNNKKHLFNKESFNILHALADAP